MCDYTLQGLRATVPDAFLSVSMYWVRKAFERSDRYLALYSMETIAMPFALREFMVKCWKRHRDTPTRIDDLVDQAFEDLATCIFDEFVVLRPFARHGGIELLAVRCEVIVDFVFGDDAPVNLGGNTGDFTGSGG